MEQSCKSITGFVPVSTECVPTEVPVITEGLEVPGTTQGAEWPVKVLVTALTISSFYFYW